MMHVESCDPSPLRPAPRSRPRQRLRSNEERADARRLAQAWVSWLRSQGISNKRIGRRLGGRSLAKRYLQGATAPRNGTLERLRDLCAEYYPGGIDDELWQTGPEQPVEASAPSVVKLPIVPRDPLAPVVRSDCQDMPRPCPAIACARNLLLDVNASGMPVVDGRTHSVCITRGSDRGWQEVEDAVFHALETAAADGRETCADDIAERGGLTLDEVGQRLGLTRERVRQIELVALRKLHNSRLAEHAE